MISGRWFPNFNHVTIQEFMDMPSELKLAVWHRSLKACGGVTADAGKHVMPILSGSHQARSYQ
ncbi:uncharacterized protein G2W53_016823 [Senna tora]|uniref:Uncharacterized protein n=1 Tax=Senna tora TaxID=362788 RepID=A0A834TX23_9FABA|nr:uncharacterized protein G2W53_016823 [Senna tora]